MKTGLKILSLMLCLLMLLGAFVGCKKSEDEETGETSAVSTDDGNLYDANGYLKDELPAKDYAGADFRVFSWDNQKVMDWGTREMSTNIIEDALYQRELNVKERFNINLDITYEPGDWSGRAEFVKKVAASVSAGATDGYHLVCQYLPSAGTATQQGLYTDLNTLEYLDLEKPWWPQYLNENAAINGKLFFASGDITVNCIKNIGAMYLNLDLYKEYKLADLPAVNGRSIYDVVTDGDWTLSMFKTMTANITEVEGDDVTYALSVTNSSICDNFLYSGGFVLAETNSDGQFVMSEDVEKSAISDWYDEIKKILNANSTINQEKEKAERKDHAFFKGKALFLNDSVSSILTPELIDAQFDYAIIPVFKRDADQKEYYTTPSFWVSMFSVPVNSPDLEMSGIIMEALASESYRTVTDRVYEEAFQSRYSTSADNSEMLDIITDNVVYDPARMFAVEINMYGSFRTCTDGLQSWKGVTSTNLSKWKTSIANLATQFA